jgi:CRP/FNR family transcriptional regulator
MKTIYRGETEFKCNIQAPCFQRLSQSEVEMIKGSKTQVQFRKGENLTKQGAFASYVLFVLEGIAKQYVEGDGGKSYCFRMAKPGDFVGLSSVFTGSTYSYSTVALTDVQAFLIDSSTILSVANNNGDFAVGLIKRYSQQNSQLFGTIRTLMYKQMNGRVAEALLYLDGLNVEDLESVFPLLTRKELADFAGVSTENVVKILKAFEKDGIVVLDDKSIAISNREVLEGIAKHG